MRIQYSVNDKSNYFHYKDNDKNRLSIKYLMRGHCRKQPANNIYKRKIV